jgi:hypothetical protein
MPMSTMTSTVPIITPTKRLLPIQQLVLLLVALFVVTSHHGGVVYANKGVMNSSHHSGTNTNNNFRVVLDSPRGHDKKTRLMIKNMLSSGNEFDIAALVNRARKEFQDMSIKTKVLTMKVSEEAKEWIDIVKDNLQQYTKKEIGFYAALTIALTLAVKSK